MVGAVQNVLAALLSDIGTPDTPAGWIGWALFVIGALVVLIQKWTSSEDETQQQTISNLKVSLDSVNVNLQSVTSRLTTVEEELQLKSKQLLDEIQKRSSLEGELKAIKEMGISEKLGNQILQALQDLREQRAAEHAENKALLETIRNLDIQDLSVGKAAAHSSKS
jgi:hypothetical protein